VTVHKRYRVCGERPFGERVPSERASHHTKKRSQQARRPKKTGEHASQQDTAEWNTHGVSQQNTSKMLKCQTAGIFLWVSQHETCVVKPEVITFASSCQLALTL
jgi:hypothetical protein